jgi:PAS domain S-box-containing protein
MPPAPTARTSAPGRALLAHAPGCLIETDALRSCTFANAGWARATGLPVEQALGHGWRAAVHPADRADLLAAWRTARRQDEAVPADHRVLRPDGSICWLAGAVAAVRDDAGALAGYVASWQDVTHRHEEAERRQRGLRRLANTALAHLETDALLPELAARTRELVAADGVAVLLAESGGLAVRAVAGTAPDPLDPLTRTVPLRSGGRRIGALRVRTPAPLADAQRELLELAADRTALAVDRAVAFEEQRAVAETLQHGLLPERLPHIPGIALAARHRPAEADMGGDFYDAFAVSPDAWLLVIGDVCGKGPDAAVLTALARYTIRAEALHDPRPASVLGALNQAIFTQRGGATFCTATCCLIEHARGATHVTIAAGGHPLPLILREDGAVEQVGHAGALLGVLEDADLLDEHVVLCSGDSLVLWTDGLTEAGAPHRMLTQADIATMVAARRGAEPAALIRGLEHDALAPVDGAPRDDLAIIALRVGESPVPGPAAQPEPGLDGPGHDAPRVVSAWIAADGFSPLRARRAVRRLEGLRDPARHAVLLLVNELVTGIVRDAGAGGGMIGLRVAAEDDRVRVELTPPSRGERPAEPDTSDEDLLRGALLRRLVARSGATLEHGTRRLWFEVEPA